MRVTFRMQKFTIFSNSRLSRIILKKKIQDKASGKQVFPNHADGPWLAFTCTYMLMHMCTHYSVNCPLHIRSLLALGFRTSIGSYVFLAFSVFYYLFLFSIYYLASVFLLLSFSPSISISVVLVSFPFSKFVFFSIFPLFPALLNVNEIFLQCC